MTSGTSVDTDPNRTGGRSATAAGVGIGILGLLAVFFPFTTGVSVSVVLGAVLVVGALVHATNAVSAGTLGHALGQAIRVVLYGFAGIVFIANPVVGLVTGVSMILVGRGTGESPAPDVPRGSQG